MRTARLGEVRGGWGGWRRLLLAVSAACTSTCTTSKTFPNLHQPAFYDPAHDLGSLFQAVQLSGIFPDSKTFVDARPLFPPSVIAARYDSAHALARAHAAARHRGHALVADPAAAPVRRAGRPLP